MLQSSKCVLVHFNKVALDRTIVLGRQVYSYVVLDQLPSPVILGMLFLANTSSNIDWYTKSVMFGD